MIMASMMIVRSILFFMMKDFSSPFVLERSEVRVGDPVGNHVV
jgi:hypothetical protein